jgi:hypothetical protein
MVGIREKGANNSCDKTLKFGRPFLLFYGLMFYCLFPFYDLFFYCPSFSPSFSLLFCLCFSLPVISSLVTSPCLRVIYLVVVVYFFSSSQNRRAKRGSREWGEKNWRCDDTIAYNYPQIVRARVSFCQQKLTFFLRRSKN